MKSRVEGKRFSKRERIEDMAPEEFRDFVKESGVPGKAADGRKQYVIPGGWRLAVDSARQAATSYLASNGLPASPRLWRLKGSDAWVEERPPSQRCSGARSIEHHIRKLGYERDSLEDMAARLLQQAVFVESSFDNGNWDVALNEAVELGRLLALARVYGMESATNTKNAKRPRRKPWAEALAHKLATEYVFFPDAWDAISEDGLEIEGLPGEVYRSCDNDGEEIICHSSQADGDDSLKREPFRTGYFSKAKQKAKKGEL